MKKPFVMTTEKKAKWIAGTLTGLLALALVSTVYFYNNGQNYKSDAEHARLAQDSILAVKQLLDKEIADMRADLSNAKGKNEELDRQLAEKETALNVKQAQIDKLVADNATVSSLRRQLKDLQAERNALNLQIEALQADNRNLVLENQRLINTISMLEGEKLVLQNRLLDADRSTNRANNFRVDMMKNNGKVTSKAKRTRDIRVSFDMPSNYSAETTGTIDLYLVMTDPAGKPVVDKNTKEVTLDNEMKIKPIKTKSVDLSASPQTVLFDISLDSKVKTKGVYKVRVFDHAGLVGSAQISMN